MKTSVLVVMVAAAFFVLTLSCAHLPQATDQQGFVVTIGADGKVKKARNLDGSEIRYDPEEKKRLPGAHLAFFVEGKKEPNSFLKKDGKWKKVPLAREGSTTGGTPGAADEIVVRVGPKGIIEKVTNSDGTLPEYEGPVDLSKARIVTVDNYCCWYPAPGGARCLCSYCPWGCR